ncbi:MAG: hypothetical protein ACLTBV_26985 [Enterocloster bolteae]
MIDNCQLDKTAFDSRVYRTEYLLLAVPAALDVNREAARYQIPLEMIHDGFLPGQQHCACSPGAVQRGALYHA